MRSLPFQLEGDFVGRKSPRFHSLRPRVLQTLRVKDRFGRSQGVFDMQEVFGWSDSTFQKASFAFGSEIE